MNLKKIENHFTKYIFLYLSYWNDIFLFSLTVIWQMLISSYLGTKCCWIDSPGFKADILLIQMNV